VRLLLQRLVGFGVIGVIATLTYAIVVIALVESLALAPTVAAVLAFVVAMQVSYFGNVRWVFADRVASAEQAGLIIRFVGVSGLSFMLNVGGMYILTEHVVLSYWWGLLFSFLAVPLVTFLAHNSWTFSGKA
jgi:putative flippase GtrA